MLFYEGLGMELFTLCCVDFQELENERVTLMEEVTFNKKKMKELEDNLLYRLTSTKVRTWSMAISLYRPYY